jgi:hypothetical protein
MTARRLLALLHTTSTPRKSHYTPVVYSKPHAFLVLRIYLNHRRTRHHPQRLRRFQ